MPHDRCALLSRAALIAALSLCSIAPAAAADSTVTRNHLWLVWIGIASILVFFMQAGFALLESGLARTKNTVNVLMKNICDTATSTLGFWLVGYGLMFGANPTGWFGTSNFAMQSQDSLQMMSLFYQVMFAATASTIMSGAVAERMRFAAYLLGATVTTLLIYPIYGSWTWNSQGWLAQLGFIDASGAAVVHSVGGWTALGAVLALGPRTGRFSRKGEVRDIPGHNLPMAALGVFILWFGWMGFNGGTTNRDFSDLAKILLNTNLGASAGLMGALGSMYLLRTPILMTRTMNGALGGLVAITAGCKTMDPWQAATAGAIGGLLVAWGEMMLERFRIDDAVGAIPVHAVCGFWGVVAAGMFYAGAPFNVERVIVQLIGSFAALVWALPLSYLTFWLIRRTVGLRVSTQEEQRGLDYAEHYEVGYAEFTTPPVNQGKQA
jgi:ammonium transporter, Amt family